MARSFRESMTVVHTWAGVLLGALLLAIFWTGTLSVFDREIDRWMMPETRLRVPESAWFEPAANLARRIAPDARSWVIALPSHREPMTVLSVRDRRGEVHRMLLDPVSGQRLRETGTLGATRFIFPLHANLRLEWHQLGAWLVGLAAMAMLALLVSGIVIHRKLIAQFFLFRPKRVPSRAILDLHNLSGLVALPFHFVITLTGLAVFHWIYFAGVIDAVYAGDEQVFFDEAYGGYSRPATGRSGEPIPLDLLADHASRAFAAPAQRIEVTHPGDRNAVVEIRAGSEASVAFNYDVRFYDGSNGALLGGSEHSPVSGLLSLMAGLHFAWFEHWPLRWLYFVLGLAGCVMIATGSIYWLETRRKAHARPRLPGVRLVEALTVASVTGAVIATLSYFVVNRLLPSSAAFAGTERAALEVSAFYLVWLATFAHAWGRSGKAWREQCRVVAGLAVLAPVLNWVTTGDHLVQTVVEGYWPVAGMDLVLLAGAAIAVYADRKLSRPRRPAITSRSEYARRAAEASRD